LKLLLINTPRSPFNAILDHASETSLKFIHKKLIGPPLGLLTIASALCDHDVTLFETKAAYDLLEQQGADAIPSLKTLVREQLEKMEPDAVGVTFIASELFYGIEILKTVKDHNPEIVTLAGGLHTTLCPGDFNHKAVDVVCPGESVKKIRDIARAIDNASPLGAVRGIFVNGPEGMTYTGEPEPVDSAGEDYLVPDRSLVEPWLSTYIVGNAPGPSTYLFTSLGCPNRCTFCSIWPQYGGAFRQRDIESVVEELKGLDQYPVVRFADGNSLVDPLFLETLFRRIKEEGIQKTFIMDLRVDAAARSPKLIEQLAQGGLKVVISGFESFRNRELEKYNKSADASLISKAIEVFHQNDIMIRGNYVIPPDYDVDDFKALKEYAGGHKVAYAGYTILTPMPGTTLFKEMRDRIVDFDLRKYNFFNSVLKTKLQKDRFYELTADLWSVRRGEDVI
jgi:radical SAM superfamily enzyme YgiQ (UPF0313 family)